MINQSNIRIRPAETKDLAALYELALATPEIKASTTEPFMSQDELAAVAMDKKSVFLVAVKNKTIAGFIYASLEDVERKFLPATACLVYLVVAPAFRRQGVANELYQRCVQELKRRGITNLYSWVKTDGDRAMFHFLEGKNFVAGHTYQWMDIHL